MQPVVRCWRRDVKPVRAGIFVATGFNKFSSSVRSNIFRICRTDGAESGFGLAFYKDAAPTALHPQSEFRTSTALFLISFWNGRAREIAAPPGK
jgi:hypothetical protein